MASEMSERRRWPTWLALLAVAGMVGLFTRAGFWQLDRLGQRLESNARQLEGLERPAVGLADAGAKTPYRRVEATGRYDPQRQVIVAGRFVDEHPGVYVLTPLIVSDGPSAGMTVLVLRGWLAASDAQSVDLTPYGEPGESVVRGVVFPDEGGAVWDPGDDWPLIVRRLSVADLRDRFGDSLFPYLIWQTPDPTLPARPQRVELPPMSEGPHFGYAIQWFSFAIVTLIGTLAYAVRARARPDL